MTKQQRKEQSIKNNELGAIGEKLALELVPCGDPMSDRWPGWDMGYFGKKLEVKTSKWSEKYQSFRFTLSKMQIINSDFVLFLCLNQFGQLWRGWVIPTDKLNQRQITLDGNNLDEYPEYRIA